MRIISLKASMAVRLLCKSWRGMKEDGYPGSAVATHGLADVCSRKRQTCDVWLNFSYRRSYSLLFSLYWSCNILSCCPTASMLIAVTTCCDYQWQHTFILVVEVIRPVSCNLIGLPAGSRREEWTEKCHFDSAHMSPSVVLKWCYPLLPTPMPTI